MKLYKIGLITFALMLSGCFQDGSQGQSGANGAAGAPGAQGSNGVAGVAGADGAAGPAGAIGPAGLPGSPGSNGNAGANGSDGAAGSSCTTQSVDSQTAKITCTDGTSSTISLTSTDKKLYARNYATDALIGKVIATSSAIIDTGTNLILSSAYQSVQGTVPTTYFLVANCTGAAYSSHSAWMKGIIQPYKKPDGTIFLGQTDPTELSSQAILSQLVNGICTTYSQASTFPAMIIHVVTLDLSADMDKVMYTYE